MENIMKYLSHLNRFPKGMMQYTGLVLLLLLASCGGEGEHPIKEERFYLEDIHKAWLTPDSIGTGFVMTDNNGISNSFSKYSESEEMGKSWTTVMGINTVTTYTEECFQNYNSTYAMRLEISMRANSSPHGDDISITLGQVGFSYDFDFERVHRLDTPFGYKYLLTTDKGYEEHDDGVVHSEVEFLFDFTTGQHTYDEVLHFTFRDFMDEWTDFTVTEFWMARGTGLVKYRLHNGITAERQ
jgi:hypothetical protein